MFKLKVKKAEHKVIKERLKLTETPRYNYVLTDNKNDVEEDKLNIVFNYTDIEKLSDLLDMIVKGESIYIEGSNEYGMKRVDSTQIIYFIVEGDELFSVIKDTKLLVKMKLYEVEDLLKDKNFIRVSKYCLVNIGHIDYVKVALNSKLDLEMSNKDHCEVNRSYLKAFRKALKSN